MYKGKHSAKSSARKGKVAVIIVAIILAVVLAVGGTVAYLTTQTDAITNVFSPSEVQCKVVDGTVDGSYAVQNTGDISAYIRVAVVCNWVDGDGNIHWQQPTFSVSGDGWKLINGFYYYKSAVPARASMLDNFLATTDIKVEKPTDGEYTCVVQVLAEAIQSEPANAIEVWGITVNDLSD